MGGRKLLFHLRLRQLGKTAALCLLPNYEEEGIRCEMREGERERGRNDEDKRRRGGEGEWDRSEFNSTAFAELRFHCARVEFCVCLAIFWLT